MGHRYKSSRHRSDEDGDRRRDEKKKKRHRREDGDDSKKDRRTSRDKEEEKEDRGGEDDRRRDHKRQKKSRSNSLDEDRKSRKHSKKHHRDEKEDDESRSRKKKDKKKDEKKDKKKKSSKSESRKSKKPDTRILISLGDPIGKPPSTLLDPEKDYFAYHEHLWVYMFREEGSVFNDMTAEETREAFRRFVKRYNVGSLAEGYYVDKLPAAVLEESRTTKHSWAFRMSATEGRSLHSIETGVRKQTEIGGSQLKVGPSGPRATVASRSEEKPAGRSREDVAMERGANRRLKAHVRTAEEEFNGGRKDGRERQLEKRKETGARIHGAARDRDSAAGMVEVTDADLYGGDDRNQFAKERQRHARQNESREKRLTELQSKEKERQQAMLTQLGLTNIKPGQRITIQPRKDT